MSFERPAGAWPSWLQISILAEMPRARRRRLLRRGFAEKTLCAIAEFMRGEVFSEHLAAERGLLQGIDPRAKLATVLFLIVLAGLFRHAATLVLFNLWLFWLARSSRIPLKTFVARVWIVVALFTGIVAFPAIFNAVRPGTPLVVLFHLSHPLKLGYLSIPAEVAITREGVAAAGLLMLRTGASVSLAVLLTLTTRWNALLKALHILLIPPIFLAVLDMSYRYIFLLLQTSSDMFMARRSRTVGRAQPREERRFVASAMGNLWSRTSALSDEVHGAMLARGYAGAPKSLLRFAMKPSDWIWIVLTLVVGMLFMGGERVFA